MISSLTFIGAEKIRRSGFSKIIHVIADSHALSNHFATKEIVAKKTAEEADLFSTMSTNLGLKSVYEIRLGSELSEAMGHREELSKLSALGIHEYAKRELADMEFLRKTESVCLKLSWQIDAKGTKFDERYFDEKYREHFSDELSFVYVKAGRTFDAKRPNVCPYTSIDGESRVLLQPKQGKILEHLPDSKTKRQTVQHLSVIVEEFEEVFGSVEGDRLENKIDRIIERCTRTIAPMAMTM